MSILSRIKQYVQEPNIAVTIDNSSKIRWEDKDIPLTVKLTNRDQTTSAIVEEVDVWLLYTWTAFNTGTVGITSDGSAVVSHHKQAGLNIDPGGEQHFSCSLELHPKQESANTGESLNDAIINISERLTNLHRNFSKVNGSYDLKVQVKVQGYKTSLIKVFTVNVRS